MDIISLIDKYLNRTCNEKRLNNTEILFRMLKIKEYTFGTIEWYKKQLSKLRTKDLDALSGFNCFIGSLLLCRILTGKIGYIRELFRYSTLYVIFDHFLDDPAAPEAEKRRMIKVIGSALRNGGKRIEIIGETKDTRIQDMLEGIEIILAKSPKALIYLLRIYDEQVQGFRLQSFQNLTREEYLSLSLNKGGYTLNAIEVIIGLEPTEDVYSLGSCIQIDDDIRDVEIDMKDRVNTIATYDYRVNGNLNELAAYLAYRIDRLDEKLFFAKSLLMFTLVHTVATNRYFSDELRKRSIDYFPLSNSATFDRIIPSIRRLMFF